MRSRSLVVLPLFVLLCVAAPAAAQSPTDELFERLNEIRAANELPPLARDSRLDGAATAHATEMATLSSLFHVSETSGSPLDRARAAGVESSDIAENVAMHDSALDAQASLEASSSHLTNMLGPTFTHVGLGVVATSSGTYITELFAHLEGASPPVAAAPAPAAPAAPATPPSTGVAPPVSGGGSIASVDVPATPAPATSAPAAVAATGGAVVVPPSPSGVVTVPSPAPGVTGYWICANRRWYYYPVPAGATGGTRLGADMSVAGPPPGRTAEECSNAMAGVPGAAPGAGTPVAPPPTTPPAPAPRTRSPIVVEPGRIITPWGTIRTR